MSIVPPAPSPKVLAAIKAPSRKISRGVFTLKSPESPLVIVPTVIAVLKIIPNSSVALTVLAPRNSTPSEALTVTLPAEPEPMAPVVMRAPSLNSRVPVSIVTSPPSPSSMADEEIPVPKVMKGLSKIGSARMSWISSASTAISPP